MPKCSNPQATALVDGKNGLGQVIGKFSMELAIKKAETFGIGMVSARGSNHYGICGYYSLMAAEKGLIGFTCTNASPLMVPTRSTTPSLGTNPLSLAMRTDKSDEFVLDMATTAVALGKIELAITKGQDIPEGWAIGANGKTTKNAKEAYDTMKLMPLGGAEENSGYKGYGLATLVEVLCGVLSGSHFGKNIRKWKADDRIAHLGHCFMAINPTVFAPGAGERLGQLLGELRGLPTPGDGKVLVAGDPERIAMQTVDSQGGIRYHQNQIKICDDVAQKLGVPPLKPVA
uniref:Mdh_1 protein n=1 Tax=Fopius arisanus TaxID=64838 RepID=A0A0C9Q6V1_9HYME